MATIDVQDTIDIDAELTALQSAAKLADRALDELRALKEQIAAAEARAIQASNEAHRRLQRALAQHGVS